MFTADRQTALPGSELHLEWEVEGATEIIIEPQVGEASSSGIKTVMIPARAGRNGIAPLPLGSVWKYNDRNVDLGISWRWPDFDDSEWPFRPR